MVLGIRNYVKDIVTLNDCMYVINQPKKTFPDAFENYFCEKKDQHNHNMRCSKCITRYTYQKQIEIWIGRFYITFYS